jgi:hypothetical protein
VKRVLLGMAVGLALLLAACGDGSPPMTGDAAAVLRDRMTAVRTAVESRDAAGAQRALDDLRQAVDRLRRQDALTGTRAADILAAATSVNDQLVTITTTTTTTTTTTSPPAPPLAGDHGKGKGNGDGNGNDEG